MLMKHFGYMWDRDSEEWVNAEMIEDSDFCKNCSSLLPVHNVCVACGYDNEWYN